MKVLLVGSGGRESALAWKLAESPQVEQLYVAPGNPGMEAVAQLLPINASGAENLEKLAAFAEKEKIDLVVVGPEGPLAQGLADRMAARGISCFGPKAKGALLESSKKYAKDFMARYNIPTAAYRAFSSAEEAVRHLESGEGPIVVKADGLAQGKGVVVAEHRWEAVDAVTEMMNDGRFGDAGRVVVVEECMRGEELSLLAFVDGKRIVTMPPVQDHKRVADGDIGPNTGGMGAYAPVAIYTPELAEEIDRRIVRPMERAIVEEGLDYRGCLYFGLMVTEDGPKVIEFNVRFGDPETQVLMPLLKSDLFETLYRCARGDLGGFTPEWHDESAVCVVLTSLGYPEEYTTGYLIRDQALPEDLDNAWIFHAGTARNAKGELVTAGGRVLAVAAREATIENALNTAYRRVEDISFEGCRFRKDIAHRELERRKRRS